jgi:hypothetical protein
MAKAEDIQALSQFSLSETEDGYLIAVEGDGGGALTLSATPEQLDAIIEALDALLSEDDALADALEDEAEG